MAAIFAPRALAGTAVSAIGAVAGGLGQKAVYDADAAAEHEAANAALAKGSMDVGEKSLQDQKVLSQAKAAAAAGGGMMASGYSGGADTILSGISSRSKFEEGKIAWGAEEQKRNLDWQGNVSTAAGKSAALTGDLKAAGDVLGGFASPAGKTVLSGAGSWLSGFAKPSGWQTTTYNADGNVIPDFG